MLELQDQGCHNINFVTPEHVVPQVIEAVAVAADRGLTLPIVYNTSAYDSLESIELMDGIVDIYMPDFKYWSAERSRSYMKAENYPEAARAAIKAMHRQVGRLVVDAEGLAKRGLIVRHLVMPSGLDETRAILRWIGEELGRDTYRFGAPGGLSLLNTSRFFATYDAHWGGTSSSMKIAVTGHSGTQAPQSMHSSGWM